MKQIGFALLFAAASVFAGELRVSSDQTVGGFKFPESVAYDAKEKVLYVGNFGGEKPAPAEKDGLGYISKVALSGKVIEGKVFPAPGGEAMNKPKGIWIRGDRLWVTDIDAVWIFDLRTKKQRRLKIPEAKFLNDPAVMGRTLYLSDNRNDMLYRVEPADFLDAKVKPKVFGAATNAEINPNGLYPGRGGILLMVGLAPEPEAKRGIYALGVSGQLKVIAEPFGRLDGLYEMKDGSLLFTDWSTGSLSHWSESGGVKQLASGFKGPADFCVVPAADGSMTVVVPDLPQSQLRFIHLRN